jgi:flavin-dependent dehydrogenase
VFLQSAQIELPAERLGDVEVHFGLDVAPRGFAWAVPVQRRCGKYVRVGLMCEHGAAEYFQRFLRRVGSRWGIGFEQSLTPRQKILPLAPIQKTYTERVVVIGDAAGLVKPTTGGGIYYSLVSAAIAAETLVAALPKDKLSERTLRDYETRWRKRLGAELRAQLALRSSARCLTDPDMDELFELANTDGLMPLIRRTAHFNYHRDLISALFQYPRARKILYRRLAG